MKWCLRVSEGAKRLEAMDAATQRKLADYVRRGGRLLLNPGLPVRGAGREACTILADFLGARVGGRVDGNARYRVGGREALAHVLAELRAVGEQLPGRMHFLDWMPPEQLRAVTASADVGGLFYRHIGRHNDYAAPNKLFDYIQARVPVLASPLPEISRVVTEYEIGDLIETHDPEHIASKIREMLGDAERLAKWKENLNLAAQKLCWESEREVLEGLYREYA